MKNTIYELSKLNDSETNKVNKPIKFLIVVFLFEKGNLKMKLL